MSYSRKGGSAMDIVVKDNTIMAKENSLSSFIPPTGIDTVDG